MHLLAFVAAEHMSGHECLLESGENGVHVGAHEALLAIESFRIAVEESAGICHPLGRFLHTGQR